MNESNTKSPYPPFADNPNNNQDLTGRSQNELLSTNKPLENTFEIRNINNNFQTPGIPSNNSNGFSYKEINLNENTNFKNVELERINHQNNRNLKLEKFSDANLPPSNYQYNQIENFDNSKFSNINLNDMSNFQQIQFDKSNLSNLKINNNDILSNINNDKLSQNFNYYDKMPTPPTPFAPNVTNINFTNSAASSNVNNNINNQLNKNLNPVDVHDEEKQKKGLSQEEKEADYYISNLNKRISLFYYIFHLLILILMIPITSLVYLARNKLNFSEAVYFTDIVNTWLTGPISSVSLNCTLIGDLISEPWPGTMNGCYCSGPDSINPGRCMKRSSCKNVDDSKPIAFDFWRGTRICTQRYASTYLDLTIAKTPDNCPQNMRNCGIIDSQKNYLCLDNNSECPYNKILKNPINYSLLKNDHMITIGNSLTLVFGRDMTNSKILFYFRVAFDQPCLNPYYENLNFNVYPLNYFYGKQKCLMYSDYSTDKETSAYNPEYQLIDSYSAAALYKENLIDKILMGLPLYDVGELQRNINLYARNYFGLKFDCFQQLKNKNIKNDLKGDLLKFYNLQDLSSVLVISFVLEFLILIFLIFSVCYFRKVLYKPRSARPTKLTLRNLCCYVILYMFSFLLHIFFVGLNAEASGNLSLSDDIKSIFSDSFCVDNFTSGMFIRFEPLLTNSKKYLSNSIFLTVIILIAQLIFIIFSYLKLKSPDFYLNKK